MLGCWTDKRCAIASHALDCCLLSVWHQKPSQCDIITSYNLEKKFEWDRDLILNLMNVSLYH